MRRSVNTLSAASMWKPSSSRSRAIGVLCSVGIVALSAWLLALATARREAPVAPPQVTVFFMPIPLRPVGRDVSPREPLPRERAAQERPPREPSPRAATAPRAPSPSPAHPASPTTNAAPQTAESAPATPALSPGVAAAEPPQPPASAPLRLGADVLRRAVATRRSAPRALAQRGGTALANEMPTSLERLSSGLAEGAKPDCLGPNANGSLLSLIIIPLQIARDQCR